MVSIAYQKSVVILKRKYNLYTLKEGLKFSFNDIVMLLYLKFVFCTMV